MLSQRLMAIVGSAIISGGLIIAGSGFGQNQPDRSRTSEEAYFAGQVDAIAASTDVAVDDLRPSLEYGLTDDVTLSIMRNSLGTLITNDATLDALQYDLRGDRDEIYESMTGVYVDLADAAKACLPAVDTADETGMEACSTDLLVANQDFEDFYDSFLDWVNGDDFSYNRD